MPVLRPHVDQRQVVALPQRGQKLRGDVAGRAGDQYFSGGHVASPALTQWAQSGKEKGGWMKPPWTFFPPVLCVLCVFVSFVLMPEALLNRSHRSGGVDAAVGPEGAGAGDAV